MFRSTWYVLLFTLAACQSGTAIREEQPKTALAVKKITVNDVSNKKVNQIVIEFNKAVSIPGAVPSGTQIAAVAIKSKNKPKCNWRFIDNQRMACELQQALAPASNFNISINTEYPGLNGEKLSQAKSLSIKTPFPELDIKGFSYDGKLMHDTYVNLGEYVDVAQLRQHLLLKSPSGYILPLLMTEIKDFENTYKIKLADPHASLLDGQYQLVLSAGYRLVDGDRALRRDVVLKRFFHFNDFVWLGFGCFVSHDDYPFVYQAVELTASGVLPCEPSRAVLRFNRRLEEGYQDSGVMPPQSLSGAYQQFDAQGVVNLRLDLHGEQSYTIDLSKVLSETGEPLTVLSSKALSSKDHSLIHFSTQAAKPGWLYPHSSYAVVESDQINEPVLFGRNVPFVDGIIRTIETADALLANLNEKSSADTGRGISARWPFVYQRPSEAQKVTVPFHQYLSGASGLVKAEFSAMDTKTSATIHSAAFNMAYWLGDDLLVYLADWQAGLTVADVAVSLVCKGLSRTVALGKTNSEGTLHINKARWTEVYGQRKECWLWGHKGLQTSAILVNPYSGRVSKGVSATAWPGQPIYRPGDTIDVGFIARQRSDSGLVAVTDLSDYQFMLVNDNGQKVLDIALSTPSEFGFAWAMLATAKTFVPGSYQFVMRHKGQRRQDSTIGSVVIEEYVTPEFEVDIDTASSLFKGQPLTVDITARRLNGVALSGATVEVSHELENAWGWPKTWSQSFSYHIDRDSDDDETVKPFVSRLSKKGQLTYASDKITASVPYGRLAVSALVTSADGEVQHHERELVYFGQNHFIGSKRLTTKPNTLEFVAVTPQGVSLTDIVLNVQFSTVKHKKQVMLSECRLSQLPGLCQLPKGVDTRIDMVVQSGVEGYTAKSYFYWRDPNAKGETQNSYDLSSKLSEVIAGQSAVLNLYSPTPGNVVFVVDADGVQRTWQQKVVKGNNRVEVAVPVSWSPVFKVSSYMAIGRQQKPALISRGLVSSVELRVVSAEPALRVDTILPQAQWQSGQAMTFTLKSNQDVEAQSWLVNDGIWQLEGSTLSEFDLAHRLSVAKTYYDRNPWGISGFAALSQHLLKPGDTFTPDEVYWAVEKIQVQGSRLMLRQRSPNTAHGASLQSGSAFASSVWLNLVSLKANKPQQVTVTLPQVPGRWRLVTVSANAQQFAFNSQTLTTTLPTEYFLDAPKTVYASDQPQMTLMVINRQKQPINKTLALWIDDKMWQSVKLSLTDNEPKLLDFVLPQLALGEHKIHLSEVQSGPVLAQSLILVKPDTQPGQLSWLYQPKQAPKLVLPEHYQSGSLRLQYTPVDALAPNWSAITAYNKYYVHQCWEQNISRALSYFYSPQAQLHWPQGKAQLTELLSQASKFLDYNDKLAYFESNEGDDFLSAYSYVIQHWLEQKGIQVPLNLYTQHQIVGSIADDKSTTVLARSMALLGLVVHGDISREQAVTLRQTIGSGSAFAQALQLFALSSVKADETLIGQATDNLLSVGYQDVGVSVVNGNAQRCFTALAIGQTHPRSQQLIAQVLNQQWHKGDFGSTFANGVCSYLLSNRQGGNSAPITTDFTINGNVASFDADQSSPYWLKLSYEVAQDKMAAQSSGLSLKRQYYVKNTDQWLLYKPGQTLAIGDIVKVVINLKSPQGREHIALTDAIAGGFEAINDRFKHQFSERQHDFAFVHHDTTQKIQNGLITFYPQHVLKGDNHFVYYAKVRFVGDYLAPAANAQMMYQPSVMVRGEVMRFRVGH